VAGSSRLATAGPRTAGGRPKLPTVPHGRSSHLPTASDSTPCPASQDGWEDDEEDEHFTKQLRAELQATEAAAQQAAPAAMQQ